jgi:hypothetical protein
MTTVHAIVRKHLHALPVVVAGASWRAEGSTLLLLLLLLQAGLTVAASTAPNQLSQWCSTEVLRDASGADDAAVQPWAGYDTMICVRFCDVCFNA